VGEYSLGNCGEGSGLFVVDGQLHQIVLQVVIFQSEEFVRIHLAFEEP
jgi:hypothetical protein